MGKLGFLATAGLGAAAGYMAAKRMPGMPGIPGMSGRSSDGAGPQETMQRLVHIARIQSGSEANVRRLVEERFPVSALAGTGIREATVFVGSTYVLTEYGFSGEYTPTFTAYRNDPTVNAFLEEIGRLLDDEPAPLPDAPAMQFLASQALHWDSSRGVEYTPRVRPKEASRDRV